MASSFCDIICECKILRYFISLLHFILIGLLSKNTRCHDTDICLTYFSILVWVHIIYFLHKFIINLLLKDNFQHFLLESAYAWFLFHTRTLYNHEQTKNKTKLNFFKIQHIIIYQIKQNRWNFMMVKTVSKSIYNKYFILLWKRT